MGCIIWIYFLKTDEIMEGFKAKGLIEAKEKLDVLKMSEKERVIYESYLEDLHLKASLADTQKFKLDKAKDDGKKEREIEMAKLMILDYEPMEKIIRYTGLSKAEVEKIMKELPCQEKEE